MQELQWIKQDVCYVFEPFVLDPKQRLLWNSKERRKVAIEPKSFNLLVFLVQNHTRPVSKDEILNSVWNDSTVEEGNVPYQISRLRAVLGDNAGDQIYISTAPKYGYQFSKKVIEAPSPSPLLQFSEPTDGPTAQFDTEEAGRNGILFGTTETNSPSKPIFEQSEIRIQETAGLASLATPAKPHPSLVKKKANKVTHIPTYGRGNTVINFIFFSEQTLAVGLGLGIFLGFISEAAACNLTKKGESLFSSHIYQTIFFMLFWGAVGWVIALLSDYKDRRTLTVGEGEACVIEKWSNRHFQFWKSYYAGKYQLPFGTWNRVKLSLGPHLYRCNEVTTVTEDGESVRLHCALDIYVVDPDQAFYKFFCRNRDYERTGQDLFGMTIHAELQHHALGKILETPETVNAALNEKINAAILKWGLRAADTQMLRLAIAKNAKDFRHQESDLPVSQPEEYWQEVCIEIKEETKAFNF